MKIPVKTNEGGYEIILERGALQKADRYLDLNRKALIVTDDGVPSQYARTAADFCSDARIVTIRQGEASKSSDTLLSLLHELVRSGFTRTDCVCAVGGGVVGDLAGFASACYMRGIDFYNIPTTLLSQVDSSIGGKTAINFEGYKNIVGAFHQPKAVLIDPDTLSSLPRRQITNGLAESIKMALTCDADLFNMIERGDADIETIIYRSLLIKKSIVEQDEQENGLRRILNFGHTLAHAVEVQSDLYHGECVAIGMLPMCAPSVRERLLPMLGRLGLPVKYDGDPNLLYEAMDHDKKKTGKTITVVYVPEIGSYRLKQLSMDELRKMIAEAEI